MFTQYQVPFTVMKPEVHPHSLAARTMAFDIRKLEWSREIFEAAGIDVKLMSEPVPTGTAAGNIGPEAARKTGLGTDVKAVSVSHGQVSAAVGAGAFDSSVAVDGAGTVSSLCIYKDIACQVAQTTKYGLLGPNGVGKSTILKMIMGILRPASGSIEFDGHPWNRTDLGN